MNRKVQDKLEMAARVRSFSRSHPSDQPEYTRVLGELEERLARAQTVAETQVNGTVASRAARIHRQELRNVVHFQLLRYLVAVSGVAAKSEGEPALKFRLPPSNGNGAVFLTAVREMLTRAEEHKEALLEKGMGSTTLDTIRKLLDQMESAREAARTGRLAHIGARADLKGLTSEIMDLVKVLDGLNRIRYNGDAEQLAAWNAAKHVTVRHRAEGDGEIPPTSGGVAPAA